MSNVKKAMPKPVKDARDELAKKGINLEKLSGEELHDNLTSSQYEKLQSCLRSFVKSYTQSDATGAKEGALMTTAYKKLGTDRSTWLSINREIM